jgi:hypothetical protein
VRHLSPRSAVFAAIAATLALVALCSSAQAAFTVFDANQLVQASPSRVQTGRLTTSGAGSTCASTKATPGLTGATPTFNVNVHTVSSRNNSPVCLTFTVAPACTQAIPLYSVIYSSLYTRGFPTIGYLGDGGAPSASAQMTASVTVPADGTLQWAVGPTTASTLCSAFHATITSPVPFATEAPELSGALAVGALLHGASGRWFAGASTASSEQWLRCDEDGASCLPIAGATASDYTPAGDDVGHTLRLRESVTSAGQSAASESDNTEVVPGQPPRAALSHTVSQGQPFVPGVDLVAGSSVDDDVLTVRTPFDVTVDGTAYQSVFVSTNGNVQFADDDKDVSDAYENDCLPSSEISSFFAPLWEDLDLSATPSEPGNGIYTTTTGTAPHRAFVIEWRGVREGTTTPIDAEAVFHEDSQTRTAVYAEPGDGGGSATIGYQERIGPEYVSQLSCDTAGSVQAGTKLDVSSSQPTIAGTPQAGQPLTGSDAQWVGGEPITTHFQWQLCDAQGDGCADAPGAIGASFTPGDDAVGHTARLSSRATNTGGTGSAVSQPSGVIAAAAPGGGGGGGAGGGGRGASTPRRHAPVLSKVSLSARSLRAKTSLKLRFTSSQAGRATVVVQHKTPGRRAGKKCVAATHANRTKKACTRYAAVRTLKPTVKARRAMAVLIKSRGLAPGTYHVVVTVTSSATKLRSRPKTLTTTVKH